MAWINHKFPILSIAHLHGRSHVNRDAVQKALVLTELEGWMNLLDTIRRSRHDDVSGMSEKCRFRVENSGPTPLEQRRLRETWDRSNNISNECEFPTGV